MIFGFIEKFIDNNTYAFEFFRNLQHRCHHCFCVRRVTIDWYTVDRLPEQS